MEAKQELTLDDLADELGRSMDYYYTKYYDSDMPDERTHYGRMYQCLEDTYNNVIEAVNMENWR